MNHWGNPLFMYKVHQKLCLLSSIVRTELTTLGEESHKEEKAYIMGIVHSQDDESKLGVFKECNIHHFQNSHNAPYTLLMQNLGGGIRRIMGNVEVAYTKKGGFLLFIRHFHISHNTPSLPPPPPPNFSMTLSLYFPWVLQSFQEKLKTAYAKQGLLWKM